MTALWILFAVMVSALLAGWAVLAERFALGRGLAARAPWAIAILGSLLLPLAPLAVRGAGALPPPLAVNHSDAAITVGAGAFGRRGAELADRLQPWIFGSAPPAWLGQLELWVLGAWAVATLVALSSLAGAALVLRRRRGAWRRAVLAGHSTLVSPDTGPAAIGVLDPEIVVPAWVLGAPEAEQRLLLRHEVEHHRARDPLLLLAGRIVLALVPWNIALRWQLRRLRAAVEMDCDARVMRHSAGAARRYALLLLDAAGRAARPAGALAFAAPTALERRLRLLTGERPPLGRRALAAAAALAIAAPLMAIAAPAPAPPTVESVRVSLAQLRMPAAPTLPASASARAELLNRHEAPSILRRRYPALLRDSGIGGTVIVNAFVDANGSVLEVRVDEGSGDSGLDQAAVEVMRELRFAPARAAGTPVATWVQHPITFIPAAAEAADDGPPVRLAIWTAGV
jgi:TonB family protein